MDETLGFTFNSVNASGRSVSGAIATASSQIINDDSTTLSISGPATMSEGSTQAYTLNLTNPIEIAGGSGDLTVTCRGNDGSASIQYDTNGLTYVPAPTDEYRVGTTITGGATSQSFNIDAVLDTDVETDEDFSVSIVDFTTGNGTIEWP